MNKERVRRIRESVTNVLTMRIGDEDDAGDPMSGLVVEVGHATYDDKGVTFKVRFVEAADKTDAERVEWGKLAPLFDLSIEHFGRTVRIGGKPFRVVKLNPRAPKFPLVGEGEDGRRYKLPEKAIERLLYDAAREAEAEKQVEAQVG